MGEEPRLYATEDTATEAELRELFSMDEEDESLAPVVATHDGSWRREGEVWRFWEFNDDQWPYLPPTP